MANKAFKIAAKLHGFKVPTPEIIDALRAVNTHPCVVAEVLHCHQRRSGHKTDVEIVGYDYRRRNGLGHAPAYGFTGRARSPSKREIARATKRVNTDRMRYGDVAVAQRSFSAGIDIAIMAAASLLGLRRFIGRKQ